MAKQPKNPIVLSKGGQKSPPVYRADMLAWLRQGWEIQPEDRIETIEEREAIKTALKPRAKVEKPPRDQRELELLQMPWQDVRSIAVSFDIEKPSGGWDEAIPDILKKEGYTED